MWNEASTHHDLGFGIPAAPPVPYAPGPHVEILPGPPASPKPKPKKGLAVTAFVIGIVAVFVWWFPLLGGVVALAAVLFGIFALASRQSNAFAIIGLVFGGIALIAQSAIMIWAITSAQQSAPVVDVSQVEVQAATALAPQLGYTPAVSCVEDLVGVVGESIECDLTDRNGAPHIATVEVTGVEGTDVAFDINVPTLSAG